MAENKTQPTPASVDEFLANIADDVRRNECLQLVAMMRRLSGVEPVMWGPSIVGFDQYHYRYATGREGDAPLYAFSPRKGDLTIYFIGFDDLADQLTRLGKHKHSVSCLYVKKLADLDLAVLEEMLVASAAKTRAMYPPK